MKHTTLTRTSILTATGICLAVSLAAQTPEKNDSIQEPALAASTLVAMATTKPNANTDRTFNYIPSTSTKDTTPSFGKVDASLGKPVSMASLASHASIAPVNTASIAIADHSSSSKSLVTFEPGVLPLAMQLDPRNIPADRLYGAAPAIVNVTFGRK